MRKVIFEKCMSTLHSCCKFETHYYSGSIPPRAYHHQTDISIPEGLISQSNSLVNIHKRSQTGDWPDRNLRSREPQRDNRPWRKARRYTRRFSRLKTIETTCGDSMSILELIQLIYSQIILQRILKTFKRAKTYLGNFTDHRTRVAGFVLRIPWWDEFYTRERGRTGRAGYIFNVLHINVVHFPCRISLMDSSRREIAVQLQGSLFLRSIFPVQRPRI